MTDIVLVRHGETTWHAENRYVGASDVPLTERGLEQARQLAHWAQSADLAAVWSSDLARAVDTARPTADATGMQLTVDPRLRELDFGDAEGLTRDEMRVAMPEAVAAFLRDPVAHHLPGGEDPHEAAQRAVDCLHDIADRHVGERVLVVCHTTIIRLVFCSLIGVPLAEYRRLLPFVHNGFLNEVRLHDGQVSMLSWNAPPDGHPDIETVGRSTSSGVPMQKGG